MSAAYKLGGAFYLSCGLVDGYYGTMDRFEWISQKLQFVFGRGLPGTVWKSREPLVIEKLSEFTTFMRARNAAEAGITTALGIPNFCGSDSIYVIDFLSAKGTPIAQRFEIWKPDAEKGGLVFHSGHCAQGRTLQQDYTDIVLHKGNSVLGKVWLTGAPCVANEISDKDVAALETLQQAGLDSMFAMPVFDGDEIQSIVAFYY